LRGKSGARRLVVGLKSNGRVELTRTEAVERAVACSKDKGNYYGLGRGGRNPKADRPYDSKGRVDCSGFVSWSLGFDRLQIFDDTNYEVGSGEKIVKVQREHWWSTDGIFESAEGLSRPGLNWFRKVAKNEPVLPGDVLVYPDYKLNGVNKQGHTGIITDVLLRFKRGAADWYDKLVVAHATPSHRLKYGNVVAVTNARAWRKKGYIVRYTGFVGE
jgi:hypothetical protein